MFNACCTAWLNNCVGWANHRFFFQFVAFMCLGASYIALHALPFFLDRFQPSLLAVRPHDQRQSVLRVFATGSTLFSLFNLQFSTPSSSYSLEFLLYLCTQSVCLPHESAARSDESDVAARSAAAASMLEWAVGGGSGGESRSRCVLSPSTGTALASFAFVLCAGAAFADGALGVWHAFLVSTGQTAIEMQINQRERSRCRQLGLVRRFIDIKQLCSQYTAVFSSRTHINNRLFNHYL